MINFLLYIFSSALMGFGIAIDVGIATIARFSSFSNEHYARDWVRKITSTHILFPMIGYYLTVVAARLLPTLSTAIGLIAAGLIVYLLISAFIDWMNPDESPESSAGVAGWALVLAVSWDALLSGPAKSAQAMSWSTMEVLFSFIIAGVVVWIVASLTSKMARKMAATFVRDETSLKKLAFRQTLFLFLEFSILGYFGALALDRMVLSWNSPPLVVFVVWACLIGAVFFSKRKRLIRARFRKLIARTGSLNKSCA